MRTTVIEALSHVCLDKQTIQYIAQGNTSTDGGALITTTSCIVERINATHRVFVLTEDSEGKCPDASDLKMAENGYQGSETGKTRVQIYKRIDGVLPENNVLECKNTTNALSTPPAGPDGDIPISPDAPGDLGFPGQASSGVGVWIKPGVINIITSKGFGAVAIADDGHLIGINALYLSHKCTGNDTYVAANEQERIYFGGKVARGTHCERGARSGEKLMLTFSDDVDCTALEMSTALPDETLTLYEAIPGVPAQCVNEFQESFSGDSGSGAPAPSSSAVRAVLGGAVAAAVAALIV